MTNREAIKVNVDVQEHKERYVLRIQDISYSSELWPSKIVRNNLDLTNAPFRAGLQGMITYDIYRKHIKFNLAKILGRFVLAMSTTHVIAGTALVR